MVPDCAESWTEQNNRDAGWLFIGEIYYFLLNNGSNASLQHVIKQ